MATADGCMLWEGALTGSGYGSVWNEGKWWLAHRLAYVQEVGDVPDGMELDHLCNKPSCCNPNHLEPVTHAENVRRGGATNVDTCKNGHPWTDENIISTGRPNRTCRICKNEANRAHRLRNLERIRAYDRERKRVTAYPGGM